MADCKPKCLDGCMYFAFYGLDRVCRHPDSPKKLIGGPLKCRLYENQETKNLPNQQKWWKEPLTFQEIEDEVYKGANEFHPTKHEVQSDNELQDLPGETA